MAVVSDDHADESYNVEEYLPSFSQETSSEPATIRWFSQDEIDQHNQENMNPGGSRVSFWAVIDDFVVESIDFLHKHPGGNKKLLATNHASTGDTGQPFAFSFSRGRNAHFPGTARIFKDGISRFLKGGSAEITFPGTYKKDKGGKLVVLGKLKKLDLACE